MQIRDSLVSLLVVLGVPVAEAEIDFNRQIRPILSQNCFFCHGFDRHERKAGLRLDTAEGAYKEAIVPGKPSESEVVVRILSNDPDDIMPPPDSHKRLKPEEIALLEQWIAEGARYAEAWSYVPPRKHTLPKVKDGKWPLNYIDHFVLARLEREQLMPAEDADNVTLLRRLFFDLTGLPPPVQVVEAFSSGNDPNAYEKIVDALLASDQYGERMAMYWLDLVRFADTVGYHGDQTHNASPYRDYVMDAFNDNMPFDQFTREQVAGDLLPNATIDQKIASCYNRLLQTSHEGGVQAKEYIAIYQADRVRNLSAVWMGATIGCAQCHDHKYDPYTIKDHYALAAFFADVDDTQHLKKGTNANPTWRGPELDVNTRRERALPEAERPKPRRVMITRALEKPRTVRVLARGNWQDDSGEIVTPAVPEFLPQIKSEGRASRLDLANWLCDVENGIGGFTARVMANRFWYLLLGKGISGVLDDFGGQGEPPEHPELLDYLAVRFYENSWNMKSLVKDIVMSHTYRQSSAASRDLMQRDPYNRLLARQSRYRLPAEMIRDNALQIGGLLNLSYGGSSARPYQPAGYYRHLNFPTRKYSHHTDSQQWRRGVYMHWQRMFLHPMLKAMDAPTREECTAERSRSNTPSAALVLLNDPTFVEAARGFAENCLRANVDKTVDERIIWMFKTALSRQPDPEELKVLLDYIEKELKNYTLNQAAAEKLITSGLSSPAENIDMVELAAWSSLARVLMNVNEFNFRN